jgi:hypothetical protein
MALGIIVFRALRSALQIPGVDKAEIARAFQMAAETLLTEKTAEPTRMH